MNCDGACIPKIRKATIGIVARNKDSNIVTGLGKEVYTDELEVAEALAINNRVKLVVEKGYQKVIIESDSKNND